MGMETDRENRREVRLYIENARETSEIHEDLMGSRQSGDYDLFTSIEPETARQLLEKAHPFVGEVEQWLQRSHWL